MARLVRVDELVRRLRLETGRSTTAVANADEKTKLVEMLRRIQDFYYEDFDWPFLYVTRSIITVKNDRHYAFPATLLPEDLTGVWVLNGTVYEPLTRGITFEHYNEYDSIQGKSARGTVTVTGGTSNPGTNKITVINVNGVDCLVTDVDWTTSNTATATLIKTQINGTTSVPNYTATSSGAVVTIFATVQAGAGANTFVVASTVAGDMTVTDVALASGVDAAQSVNPQRYDIVEDDGTDLVSLEIWPVPSEADTIYLTGKRTLTAFSADSDTADLDDTLLVMTAAAELMAGKKQGSEASVKAAIATARYAKLKARYAVGRTSFQLRGPAPGGATLPGVTVKVAR